MTLIPDMKQLPQSKSLVKIMINIKKVSKIKTGKSKSIFSLHLVKEQNFIIDILRIVRHLDEKACII